MTNKEQIMDTQVETLKAYQQAVLRNQAAIEEARAAADNLLKARAAWEAATAQFNEVYGVKKAEARPTVGAPIVAGG